MATGQSLIKRAMRLIGVLGTGETLSGDGAAEGLEALNAMLDSWRNEKLMVYAIQDESLTLTPSKQMYTIGPSGDLSTTRPVRIESAYLTISSLDYPVDVVDAEEWAAIPNKSITNTVVSKVYYQPTMSTGTLYTWPVSTVANTLHLLTWTPFSSLTAVSDSVTLPPGYENAIAFNLAVSIAPEYGVSAPPEVVSIASATKAAIKRVNSRPITANSGIEGLVESDWKYNIYIDE